MEGRGVTFQTAARVMLVLKGRDFVLFNPGHAIFVGSPFPIKFPASVVAKLERYYELSFE